MRQSHQNYNLYGTFHAIHRRQLTLGIWWTVFPITTWKWGGLMDDWYIHTVSSLSKSVKIKIDGKCKQPLQAHIIQTKRSGDKINQSNYRSCRTNIDAEQNNSSHELHCSFHPAPPPTPHKYRVIFTMCSFALSHLQTVSHGLEFSLTQLY